MSDADIPVLLRTARQEDIPALAEFIQPFIDAKKLLPRTEDELDLLIAAGFIAELDGRIVGFAALEVYSKKLAEVRSLAVEPSMQGRGIGRRLIHACVERAKERNVLEVMAITSEEMFFKSCGFDFTLPGEKKALFMRTREND